MEYGNIYILLRDTTVYTPVFDKYTEETCHTF